jgi:hypothetical protein
MDTLRIFEIRGQGRLMEVTDRRRIIWSLRTA